MDEEEVNKNRYGYLLQPIKDLAENWNVDIATELEKYLEELTELLVDFAGKKMNFTEAALLIQGSAAVYSKKVEYLHGLVMSTLELLADRRKQKAQKDGEDGDGEMGDDGENIEEDWQEEFDFVDVKIPNAKENCINFVEEHKRIDDILTGALANPNLMPPIPISLIPLEEWEKSDVVIINASGEVAGKREDFRVNTCFVHAKTGALLLDLENEKYIDMINPVEHERLFSRQTDVFGFVANSQKTNTAPNSQQPISSQQTNNQFATGAASPAQADSFGGDSPEAAEGTMVDHLSYEPMEATHGDATLVPGDLLGARASSVEIARDGAMTMLRNDEPMPLRGSSANLITERQAQRSSGRIAERILIASQIENRPGESVTKKKRDWFVELDAFCSADSRMEKPVANKKCTRNAKQRQRIDDRKYDRLHGGVPEPEVNAGYPRMWLSEYVTMQFYSAKRKLPKGKFKAPFDPALESLALKEYKRRQEVKRTWRNFRNLDLVVETDDDSDVENDLGQIDDDVDVGFDDDAQPLDDVQPIGDAITQDVPEINIEDADFAVPANDLQDRKNQCLQQLQQNDNLTALNFAEMTYQELVEYFVEKYVSSAQDFVTTSELTRRVQDWEMRVRPMLDDEDTRRHFDIHLYGTELLNKFNNLSEVKSFWDVLGPVPDYDVSRYFLSSLMMANTGNVEVGHNEMKSNLTPGEHEMDRMSLKLLKRERHHEQFH